MNLVEYLERQVEWSTRVFGPGDRTAGVLDHIRKELDEVAAAPGDLEEWIDLAILAFDGAWRNGHSPEAIAAALEAKQVKNAARKWPDWRTAEPGKAIEHVRDRSSYDQRCEDLAGVFLNDLPHDVEDVRELARQIQDTIETFTVSIADVKGVE